GWLGKCRGQRMGFSEGERTLQRVAQSVARDRSRTGQQSDVRQIFDPRIRSLPRHGVRVQLFGDVRFNRIELELGWLNPSKAEVIAGLDHFDLADQWVTNGDVHSKGLAVKLSRQPALCAEA